MRLKVLRFEPVNNLVNRKCPSKRLFHSIVPYKVNERGTRVYPIIRAVDVHGIGETVLQLDSSDLVCKDICLG